MAGRRVLLLHSPLVGPASLAPTRNALEARGHDVLLPDLTGVVDEPRPAWVIDAALSRADGAHVDLVVAHSGAGALLPVVAVGLAATHIVFLDAVLPDASAAWWEPDDRLGRLLAEHTDPDGRLTPWLTWWDDDLVARMLPDTEQRAAIAADCPRLPATYYDHPVPVPEVWPPAGYLALGGAYADEVARAGAQGWPVRSLGLHHLATVTRPAEVSAALDEVVGELDD